MREITSAVQQYRMLMRGLEGELEEPKQLMFPDSRSHFEREDSLLNLVAAKLKEHFKQPVVVNARSNQFTHEPYPYNPTEPTFKYRIEFSVKTGNKTQNYNGEVTWSHASQLGYKTEYKDTTTYTINYYTV